MAAPRVWKVFGNQRVGLCWHLHLDSRIPALAPTSHIQVRHRNQNPRFRDPHVAKAKEKWKKTTKASVVKETSVDHPSWQSRVPLDDVWIRQYYPTPSYNIEETILMHKEYADPTMLDNMEGFVYADMELDMSTKKKTKFMNNVKVTVLLPHQFEDGEEKNCLVFCKTEEEKEKAVRLGAKFAGGSELIKQIQDDDIQREEYNFVLSTPDIIPEIMALRPILRDKFPAKQKGNLSSDLEEMMKLFTKGLTYESSKPEPHQGLLQVPLGTLNMSVRELSENFKTLVESVCSQRHSQLGPFIKKIKIIAPPSSEKFFLKLKDYVPGYEVKTEVKEDAGEEPEDEEEEAEAAR